MEDEKLEELIRNHQSNENFYKLTFRIARKAREEKTVEKVFEVLMDYYNEIIDCSHLTKVLTNEIKTINPKLNIHELDFKYGRDFREIKSRVSIFTLKKFDLVIFAELVQQFQGNKIDFISDDEKFVKKANDALDFPKDDYPVENITFRTV